MFKLKEKLFTSERQILTTLCFFYLINHVWIMFIPNAIFWDDWIFYNASNEVLFESSKQFGSFLNFHTYIYILTNSFGAWSYKFLTLILFFFTGLVLNQIILRNNYLSQDLRFLIVLLFLCLPFNLARVSMVILPYTVCIFLFFLAWLVMPKYRLISLILFFISFNTNSFLVFYTLPYLDLFFKRNYFSLKNLINFSIKNLDYFVIPFFFYLIKTSYFAPSGIYEGYNETFSIHGLIMSPLYMAWNWINVELNIYLLVFSFIFYFFIVKKMLLPMNLASNYSRKVMFSLGILSFFLGGFAYWILGLTPIFNDWNSRHQALLFLGTSIILATAILCAKNRNRVILLTFFLSISFSINFLTYASFYKDWKKQEMLVYEFRDNDEIRAGSLIIIKDFTEAENAFKRYYRSYEWSGILERAFGDEKRMGINKSEFETIASKKILDHYLIAPSLYNSKDFKISNLQSAIEIEINYKNNLKNKPNALSSFFFPNELELSIINKDTLKLNLDYLLEN